jgi:predicted nucleotidyltransferase
MRVSDKNVTVFKNAVHATFPSGAKVFLFGSRLDDHKRGGDIDLMVVSNQQRTVLETAKIAAITKIQMTLGEQKIDLIVTNDPERDPRPVVREALRHGVEL